MKKNKLYPLQTLSFRSPYILDLIIYLCSIFISGAGLKREPDQDLVPEQEGQAKEVLRSEGGAGSDADGPGTL